MTLPGNGRDPSAASLPSGVEVASFDNYVRAQRTLAYLSRQGFPVQALSIVGKDVHVVERVTGRLTYAKVAFSGLMGGCWFGLFIGLLLGLSGTETSLNLPAAIALGAGFGMIFSIIMYTMNSKRRDYTTSSHVVAGTYTLICEVEKAAAARNLLSQMHLERP